MTFGHSQECPNVVEEVLILGEDGMIFRYESIQDIRLCFSDDIRDFYGHLWWI